MSIINRLSEHLTNMIAAGEVVERPSGIVKELVDNSIDANATRIEVTITQGGIESIQVVDNGKGMDASDASMAFERHATSKIIEEDDLWNINTLGFRGEALPSIASVSKVCLNTSDGNDATEIRIHYGNFVEAKPKPCNQGTTILVEGLFLKTPARLKHLKSPQYEASIVNDVMCKFALAYPHISFCLINENTVVLQTSGNGKLLDVIGAIYGIEVCKNSFAINGNDYDYTIDGIGVLPSVNRASKNYINIFINNRMIRLYRIQTSIISCYRQYMMDNRYPIICLNIKMDPHIVDVNVHPSKWEVRLSKEKQLDDLISRVLKEALTNKMEAPKMTFNNTKATKVKVEEIKLFSEPKINIQELSYDTQTASKVEVVEETKINYEPILENKAEVICKNEEIIVENQPTTKVEAKVNNFPQLDVIGQMQGKYILCSSEEGLYIVDQHAAEERCNYERFLDSFFTNDLRQPLLLPLTLEVSKNVMSRFEEINDDLKKINLEFERFGNDTLLIRDIPSWMVNIDEKQFLTDVLDLYSNNNKFSINELNKDKLATLACHSSIRFNHVLTMDEMKMIITKLSKCKNPFNCPHGRPTFMLITNRDLERNFKR